MMLNTVPGEKSTETLMVELLIATAVTFLGRSGAFPVKCRKQFI